MALSPASSTKDKRHDPIEDLTLDDYKTNTTVKPPSIIVESSIQPKTFGSTQESRTKIVSVIRNDDSESTNSDTEYMKKAKERNLKNLKRKAITSRSRKQQDLSTSDTSDDDDQDGNTKFYERKFKLSSASSASSTSNTVSTVNEQQKSQQNSNDVEICADQTDCTRPPKRKKSRWGPDAVATISEIGPNNISIPINSIDFSTSPSISTVATTVSEEVPKSTTTMLSNVSRSDPGLLKFARENFGNTNLTDDDWKKAEEHYKIHLLYQDMLRKRQELEFLTKHHKFKYEYDSDENIEGGTWEHKQRSQEMEATLKWAEALNQQCNGKHHIGDFLPPEELKKFMEKYEAQKNSRQPDISDYKEYKLKEDNIGYQMLQKLGWKGEGTALGASGSGITEPVNKATQRDNHQGLGIENVEAPNENDNEYDAYRKRMMLAYRFRPNPLNNPRRAYY